MDDLENKTKLGRSMRDFEQEASDNHEKQLASSQNQEAIELLAGGVAHEFNNILAIILSHSNMLLEHLDPNDPKASDLEEIRNAAERAAALTRQLLAFGCKQMLRPNILDINILIREKERLIRPLLGQEIELLISLKDELGKVRVDPEQIELVITNLVANARDAMPSGGKLIIETENVFLDNEYAKNHIGLKPGYYVEITISDTGHGMDQTTKSRIFEPFFTTREKGRGRGLGLSTAYGIIKQSQGHIRVQSEPGRGTTFKIYLPRVE